MVLWVVVLMRSWGDDVPPHGHDAQGNVTLPPPLDGGGRRRRR